MSKGFSLGQGRNIILTGSEDTFLKINEYHKDVN
jgi:hypothetical protein